MSQAPVTRRTAAPRAAGAGAAGARLGLALVVIATAQLMVVLDATIVNVALPHIQRALGFSGSGPEWVVNAYALTFGGLLLLAGSPAVAGGLCWLSRLGEHGSYAGAVLGPMLVIATGLGLLFVPATLVAMSRVADEKSGVAASLRTTGQQVGGAIGLAVLGTVAWTVVANSIRAETAHAAAAAQAGSAARPSRAALTAVYHHALATGFSGAFLVAAGAMLLALVITIIAIRVRRADLGEARL